MTFDLIVVGGGPVGAALARAARGLSVALVAASRPVPPSAELDARVYTVSPGNVAFLRRIGAWKRIPVGRTAPVHAMRVFGDRPGAELTFDAYHAGVAELAWTVEDAVLQQALWQGLDERDGVQVFAPAECERLEVAAHGVTLALRDGRSLEGRLVVGADGARSFVRAQAGIAAVESDYAQSALVANFACAKPHCGAAWQWFQGGPVLALLPLPGGRVSMVWSLPAGEAERLETLGPRALCEALEAASRGALGGFECVTPPRRYALRRLSAERMVAPRVALAGDACHVIHPLAGQGANLGMQDVRLLAETLAAREPVRDPGDARLLRRYARARAEPVLAMEALVHGLHRLFESGAWSRPRNAGLNLTDRLPVLKNLLMRHAMA